MTERHNPREPASDLEEEGITDMEGAFPGEAAAHDAAHLLVEPEDGSLDDEEADLVGSMPGYDTGGRSPEEAAVYVTGEDDAPGVSWDESPDYIGEEAPGGAANESPGR